MDRILLQKMFEKSQKKKQKKNKKIQKVKKKKNNKKQETLSVTTTQTHTKQNKERHKTKQNQQHTKKQSTLIQVTKHCTICNCLPYLISNIKQAQTTTLPDAVVLISPPPIPVVV